MHMIIGADGTVALTDTTDFTAFDVRSDDIAELTAERALAALGRRGSVASETDHVFVRIDAVRELAGEAVDDAWNAGFAAMVSHASSQGWIGEGGESIKAHIAP